MAITIKKSASKVTVPKVQTTPYNSGTSGGGGNVTIKQSSAYTVKPVIPVYPVASYTAVNSTAKPSPLVSVASQTANNLSSVAVKQPSNTTVAPTSPQQSMNTANGAVTLAPPSLPYTTVNSTMKPSDAIVAATMSMQQSDLMQKISASNSSIASPTQPYNVRSPLTIGNTTRSATWNDTVTTTQGTLGANWQDSMEVVDHGYDVTTYPGNGDYNDGYGYGGGGGGGDWSSQMNWVSQMITWRI
jgi:hypothetical protein